MPVFKRLLASVAAPQPVGTHLFRLCPQSRLCRPCLQPRQEDVDLAIRALRVYVCMFCVRDVVGGKTEDHGEACMIFERSLCFFVSLNSSPSQSQGHPGGAPAHPSAASGRPTLPPACRVGLIKTDRCLRNLTQILPFGKRAMEHHTA